MPIALNTVVARTDNLLTTPADDDLVILSLESDHYVGLDPVGKRIWELLETPRTVDDLCAQLGREFCGQTERIRDDVLKFLDALAREGLIRAGEEY
ncbi:MAG: PqqD family protein [Chloroflexota bacterium]